MATSTIEDYIKHLYLLDTQEVGALTPMGRLAAAVGVTPGTATSMVKVLAESGLVEYEPRQGVSLTDTGEKLALHVLRRHRLVELLLVDVLGLDWSEVHDEAEHLEHAISDKVVERIDILLGHPQFDPHGDPIPPAQGTLENRELSNLCDCPLQIPHRIARVIDQNACFLQFADRNGLTPGTTVAVHSRDTLADSVTLQADNEAVTLGTTAAQKILVEPLA